MRVWGFLKFTLLGLMIFAAADVAVAQTSAPAGYAETLRWYHVQAEAGDPKAQFLLAIKYETGTDVAQDMDKARELYIRAARQGHADAQFKAGTFAQADAARDGQLKVAEDWYRASALQGHAPAQYNLAVMLTNNAREADQFLEATSWAIRATRSGLEPAQALQDGLLARLSQSDRDEARRLASIPLQ